jgi:hypothetical protein
LLLAEHREGLRDLGVEGRRLRKQGEQLAVAHLEQHARDLARQVRLHILHQREESLAEQLLLLFGWRRRKRGSVDLLRRHLRLCWRSEHIELILLPLNLELGRLEQDAHASRQVLDPKLPRCKLLLQRLQLSLQARTAGYRLIERVLQLDMRGEL